MSVISPDLKVKGSAKGSSIRGVFAPEIVIKDAIEKGIQDLRTNPWELKLIFAYYLDIPSLGEKERDRAVSWFLNTEKPNGIPVLWDLQAVNQPFPSVSYSLVGGEQVEDTLSHLNYDVSEPAQAAWEPLTGAFTAAYESSTGVVTIPTSIQVPISAGMFLVDGTGTSYEILDAQDNNTFTIRSGLVLSLNNCVIKNNQSRLVNGIGSVNFSENVRLGIHTNGDPITLVWLFSIVKYVLLKYEKVLLEGRGFERLVITYGPAVLDPVLSNPERVYTRFITINCKARDFWVNTQSERVLATTFGAAPDGLRFSPVGTVTDENSVFGTEPGNTDPEWAALMDSDGISTVK